VITRYTVEVLRSGQPRAYADTENEYLVRCEMERSYGPDKGQMKPWLYGLDEATRLTWAKSLVKVLCQTFREAGDDDGRTGMEAHFYPTLRSLVIDQNTGTIRALIIEPYTD
jgi:hypothetical protein